MTAKALLTCTIAGMVGTWGMIAWAVWRIWTGAV